jgi:CheY-like chemotaxis protein
MLPSFINLIMLSANYTIFYTDDDSDDQDFFKEIVTEINSNHKIHFQTNGNELIDTLKNPPPHPHIVFLDLNMPQKNGYDVLKEIRAMESSKDVPVIIFSTSNDDAAIEKTKLLGANLYITKPSSYSEFKKVISSVLSYDWMHFSPPTRDFLFTVN